MDAEKKADLKQQIKIALALISSIANTMNFFNSSSVSISEGDGHRLQEQINIVADKLADISPYHTEYLRDSAGNIFLKGAYGGYYNNPFYWGGMVATMKYLYSDSFEQHYIN